jgi:hypothetical protein
MNFDPCGGEIPCAPLRLHKVKRRIKTSSAAIGNNSLGVQAILPTSGKITAGHGAREVNLTMDRIFMTSQMGTIAKRSAALVTGLGLLVRCLGWSRGRHSEEHDEHLCMTLQAVLTSNEAMEALLG